MARGNSNVTHVITTQCRCVQICIIGRRAPMPAGRHRRDMVMILAAFRAYSCILRGWGKCSVQTAPGYGHRSFGTAPAGLESDEKLDATIF